VRIPPGSHGGNSQRVPGEGSPGRRGGPAGDLHVVVRVKPDPWFRIEADVLVCEVPLSPDEAALGAEVEIALPGTTVRMKIPPGTQAGAVFRVRGKGLPRAGGGRSDAHVRISVEVPTALSDEAATLLTRLGEVCDDSSYPRRKAFRNRARRPSHE